MEEHSTFVQLALLMSFFIREFLHVWAPKHNHYRQRKWRPINSYCSLHDINHKAKSHEYSSLIAYGDFFRPLSFVLAREDKCYNLGEARMFISQGFRYIHFMTDQKVLQIKTKCIKENTRKKKSCRSKL